MDFPAPVIALVEGGGNQADGAIGARVLVPRLDTAGCDVFHDLARLESGVEEPETGYRRSGCGDLLEAVHGREDPGDVEGLFRYG